MLGNTGACSQVTRGGASPVQACLEIIGTKCVYLLLCASLKLLYPKIYSWVFADNISNLMLLWLLWLLQPSPLWKTKDNWFSSMHLCVLVPRLHPAFDDELDNNTFAYCVCSNSNGSKYTRQRVPGSRYIVAFITLHLYQRRGWSPVWWMPLCTKKQPLTAMYILTHMLYVAIKDGKFT